MLIERRISATFKDLPGGQLLGPTFDYTHRLLDPDLPRRRPMSRRRRSATPATQAACRASPTSSAAKA